MVPELSEVLRQQVARRRVLKGLVVGGAAAALPSIAGISNALAGPNNSIVWGKPLETLEYDPHTAILGSSWQLLHVVYDSLVEMDDAMQPVPGLASSWMQPNDASYVFTLRDGVSFSNGRPMTADDVVGSILRLAAPETGSFWGLSQIGQIVQVSKVDDKNVRVDLERPYAPFLHSMAPTMSSVIPMKELQEGSFDPTKEMLGTGPFAVESHAQDDSWTLTRNQHYWKSGLPKADKLVVKIVPADQARIAGLRDGSIDIASFEASPDAPLLVRGIEGIEVVTEDVTNIYYLALNAVWDQSPFRDERLRRAIALTIDRDQIRDLALGGAGEPTTVMAPAFGSCDASKLAYHHTDLEQAKTLVTEAGADGLTFELLVRNIPADIMMAQVIQRGAEAIGLKAEIAVVDQGTAVKRVWIDNPSIFQASISWYAGYSDPAMMPLWWNPAAAGFTAGHVPDDPAINAAIAAARDLPADDPSRPAALQSLCELVDAQAVKVPLCTRQDTIAYRADKVNATIRHLEGYVDTVHGIESYEVLG